MPKGLRPRPTGKARSPQSPRRRIDKALADEIRRTARPADQEPAIGRLSRAIDLLERGDAGAAAREAEKAKALAPRSAAVREVLGMAHYRQEGWPEALAELQAYRRLSGRADQNHLIADALRALDRPAEAVPLAEEELAGSATNAAKAEAVIVAASALADQGRWAEALAFLRRARTREDVSEGYTLRLWYVRGDILARAGRRREAAEEFRKVVRHDPGAFDAAERLAQLG